MSNICLNCGWTGTTSIMDTEPCCSNERHMNTKVVGKRIEELEARQAVWDQAMEQRCRDAVAAERKRCAQIAEEYAKGEPAGYWPVGKQIAAAIRRMEAQLSAIHPRSGMNKWGSKND